jgi:uncharacterized tellurite resistance protein B-like protein
MLRRLADLIDNTLLGGAEDAGDETAEHARRLATAALLVETARADFTVEDAELERLSTLVRQAFGLSAEETDELVALARAEADAATSLYEFTSRLNAHVTAADKVHMVELMWRVAYADGDLDKYEEHLVRRVADLLHVPHSEFIRAKLRAQPAPE